MFAIWLLPFVWYVCGLSKKKKKVICSEHSFFIQNVFVSPAYTSKLAKFLCFTTCKAGLLIVKKKKKKNSGSYLATHSETRQENWRENKEERNIDTFTEMGENRETNWKREGKRETSKETFIGESWQTVYSLQLISHHGRYRTHALTRTYILAFTTIKRTKHNNKKKRSPWVFLAHCGGE